MDIRELIELTGAVLLTPEADLSREIRCGYCCDLLSWVMAHGQSGMVWITVQTHVNVVAVAALTEIAAILVPEGIQVDSGTLREAAKSGVAMLSSEKPAYHLSGLLYGAGIGGCHE